MSPKIVEFDQMFALIVKLLKFNGSHPNVARDKKWFMDFVIKHGLYTLVFSVIFYNIYINILHHNISEACRYGTMAVMYFIVTYHYMVLLFYQKTILKLIDMMKEDYKKDMPEDDRDVVYEYARKGRRVSLECLGVSVTTVFILIGTHILLEVYTYVTDGWKLLQMFPLTFPGVIEDYKEQPIVYALIYFSILYYLAYSGTMYIGFNPLGPIFMTHATGQLEITRKKSLELYSNADVEVHIKLKEIIQHLQYIYEFMELVIDTFRLVYEITLKSTVVILPITVYQVIESFRRGESRLDYMIIIIGSLVISGSPCYHSDKLMEKGEDVREALYSCGWETRNDQAVRKTLLIIMLRTRQPIAICTIFRTVCLDTFAEILQQSYTLFNLMNAVWN